MIVIPSMDLRGNAKDRSLEAGYSHCLLGNLDKGKCQHFLGWIEIHGAIGHKMSFLLSLGISYTLFIGPHSTGPCYIFQSTNSSSKRVLGIQVK